MLGSVCMSEGFNFIFNVTYFQLCFNLTFSVESSLIKFDALIHAVLVHVYLKITATKISTFIIHKYGFEKNWVKTFIKIPAF
jgi:hypothetical protein